MEENNKFFLYKNKPLVRNGSTIYYGDMNDDYVAKIDIISQSESMGMELADLVSVQLLITDPEVSARKRIVKTSKKKSLFLALDIADVWLERALKNK